MALRDIVKIGSRVLGATGGFLIGGPIGAAAGYGIGATVGDVVAGSPEEKMVQNVEVGAYDPTSGFQTDLKSRVNKSESLVSQPGWSDKVTAVTDPIAATVSNLYGLEGGGDKVADASNKTWRSDMGSMTKKWKPTKGISTVSDISDVTSSLNDTNDMITEAYQKAIVNRESTLPVMKASNTGQYIGENIPYIGLYPTLKRYNY